MKDELGERMKSQYEDRYRFSLPRRTYTILRLDGKAFHTYTRGLQKPFDKDLIADIDAAILEMLPCIQGAVFAYTQSDEISILLTDFATPNTDAWFNGNIQKMVSVSASLMTAEFNKLRLQRSLTQHLRKNGVGNSFYYERFDVVDIKSFVTAHFDSRAFTIPDPTEVMNYFRWRQQDCIRNSLSMVAQAHFPHRELQGVPSSGLHEFLYQKGVNWATDFSDGEKNGRIIVKEEYTTYKSGPYMTIGPHSLGSNISRTRWVAKGAWVFTQDEGKLLKMIPTYL